MICKPAHESSAVPPFAALMLASMAANVLAPTIEISSITINFVFRSLWAVLFRVAAFLETEPPSSATCVCFDHEMPNNENTVLPPTLKAAVPVGPHVFNHSDRP